jgi:hypothetical protein
MEPTIIEDGRSSAKFSGPLLVKKSTDLWIKDEVRAWLERASDMGKLG